jgi:hypothetical protein
MFPVWCGSLLNLVYPDHSGRIKTMQGESLNALWLKRQRHYKGTKFRVKIEMWAMFENHSKVVQITGIA